MKKHFLIISLIALLMLGCRHPNHSNRPHWPSISPEIDSLTWLLESQFPIGAPNDSLSSWVEALRRADKGGPRSLIFGARLAYHYGDIDEAKNLLQRAKQLTDSVKDSYSWSRIRMTEATLREDDFERFMIYNDLLRYYRSINDVYSLSAVLLNLSSYFRRIGQPRQALSYLEMSLHKLDSMGYKDLVTRCNVNKVTILNNLNLSRQADSIRQILLADESLKHDTCTWEIVLRNTYNDTKDLKYIKEDYETVREKPYAQSVMPVILWLMAQGYRLNGMPDSAYHYAQLAHDRISFTPRMKQQVMINYEYALALEYKGKTDSACYYHRMNIEICDTLDKINATADVLRMELQDRILQYEKEEHYRIVKERISWILAICLLLAVAGVTAFLVYRRTQLMRLRQARQQLELERNQRHIAATLLAMEEKDRLLSTMKRNLAKLNQNPQTGETSVRELENMLKVHSAGAEERETFSDMFEKVSPAFVTNLKRRYPNLSDYYLKLASYIYAGMSNHQIARLLMVRLESVHQSRTRLRAKLGLKPTDSLEDTLRAIADS